MPRLFSQGLRSRSTSAFLAQHRSNAVVQHRMKPWQALQWRFCHATHDLNQFFDQNFTGSETTNELGSQICDGGAVPWTPRTPSSSHIATSGSIEENVMDDLNRLLDQTFDSEVWQLDPRSHQVAVGLEGDVVDEVHRGSAGSSQVCFAASSNLVADHPNPSDLNPAGLESAEDLTLLLRRMPIGFLHNVFGHRFGSITAELPDQAQGKGDSGRADVSVQQQGMVFSDLALKSESGATEIVAAHFSDGTSPVRVNLSEADNSHRLGDKGSNLQSDELAELLSSLDQNFDVEPMGVHAMQCADDGLFHSPLLEVGDIERAVLGNNQILDLNRLLDQNADADLNNLESMYTATAGEPSGLSSFRLDTCNAQDVLSVSKRLESFGCFDPSSVADYPGHTKVAATSRHAQAGIAQPKFESAAPTHEPEFVWPTSDSSVTEVDDLSRLLDQSFDVEIEQPDNAGMMRHFSTTATVASSSTFLRPEGPRVNHNEEDIVDVQDNVNAQKIPGSGFIGLHNDVTISTIEDISQMPIPVTDTSVLDPDDLLALVEQGFGCDTHTPLTHAAGSADKHSILEALASSNGDGGAKVGMAPAAGLQDTWDSQSMAAGVCSDELNYLVDQNFDFDG